MTYGPYTPFERDRFILRDRLAMDRTTLANERTLLAYLRTSLTLIIVSVTFLQFLDTVFTSVVGWAMAPTAVVIAIVGIWRYTVRQRMIARFKAVSPQTVHREEKERAEERELDEDESVED